MKYIVTNGCSFTRQFRRIGISGTADDFMDDHISQWKWPHFIQQQFPQYKVLNYGNPTNDNGVIAQSTIYGLSKLLKEGVPASEITAIIQWSGWSRNSAFISKKKQFEKGYQLNRNFIKERDKNTELVEDFAHVGDFIDSPKRYPGEHGYYILSGGYHASHVKVRSIDYFDHYVHHVFSADERMIEYFKNILLVQYFCKANGIKYKCFTMHNNFSVDYTLDDRFPLFAPEDSKKDQAWHVFMEQYIPHTWKNDIEIQYKDKPYVKYLYDLIDLDNFWFYEKDGVTKFGGQVEWCIQNYNFDEVSDNDEIPNLIWQEYRSPWDNGKRTKEDILEYFKSNNYWQHASPYSNRKFVKNELSDFLKQLQDKTIL